MRRNSFTRGLITGTIIGATMSMMVNPMENRNRKKMRRKTNNLLRTVGEVIEDLVYMAR